MRHVAGAAVVAVLLAAACSTDAGDISSPATSAASSATDPVPQTTAASGTSEQAPSETAETTVPEATTSESELEDAADERGADDDSVFGDESEAEQQPATAQESGEADEATAEDPAAEADQAAEAEVDDEPIGVTEATKVARVRDLLDALVVASEIDGGYDRHLFKHWVDADGNGCDARREVLIAEAVVAPSVGSRCSLSGGEWLSRYDGKTTTGNGSSFDVDHMVPLAEAWESGARDWSADRRERYANDLGYADSLVAVSAASNRSKGGRDPAEWMPPVQGVHCWYAAAWVRVKTRWSLTVDRAEADKLASVLAGCDDSDLDDLPEAQSAPAETAADEESVTDKKSEEEAVDEEPDSEPDNDCHPAYEPCLPNLPGDALNCGDLSSSQKPVRIKEIGVDPYRFDRDKDGWGCTG